MQDRDAGSWELVSWQLERLLVSQRFDRISRDALIAGKSPKKMPTLAEKPMPMANDHQGSDTGKPESQWTSRPISCRR